MSLQRQRSEARKRDTREKIQLGGLIVKAGLRHEDKAVLLGALIDALGRLAVSDERARLTAIGKRAFGNEGKTPAIGDDAGDTDDRHHSGPERR
jgi:hypothetical protein